MKNAPKGFKNPTSLPDSKKEAESWQNKNFEWWEKNPMRYDWKETILAQEFSADFFNEIDRRFFDNAGEYLDNSFEIPFDEFINFKSLKNKDVLEIGVGNGSHAKLLAKYAKFFTGIDITDYAVKSTLKRMEIFGLKANIIKMDAENMNFKDGSFDFVWSWGVIHHSSDTGKIIKEIHRILRTNGKAVIMVYHRDWWNYYVLGFLRGFIFGDFFRGLNLSRSVQKYTDGAIARYYRRHDFEEMTGNLFKINKIETIGPKSDVIPLPGGKLKEWFKKKLPRGLNKFLTKNFKMGSFLVLELIKR